MKLGSLFLFSLLVSLVYGQSVKNSPNHIWIDKPLLKKDSLAITNGKFSKIKVFSTTNYSANKELIGEWNIKIANGDIVSALWTGYTDEHYHTNEFLTIKRNKKVVEKLSCDKSLNCPEYKLIHYMDEFGSISKTENYPLNNLLEKRYTFWQIEYNHCNGLLIESNYFEAILTGGEHKQYRKITFEYFN